MIYIVTKQDIPETNEIRRLSVDNCLKMVEYPMLYGFDVETSGLDVFTSELLTIQIGTLHNQIVVDCKTIPIHLFKKFFEDITRQFVGHNLKFDLKFLYKQGIVPPRVWDTYLAESVIRKGDKLTKKGLGNLIKKYFNIELNKDIRGKIVKEGLTERVIKYCADDVKYLLELKDKQTELIEELRLLESLALENLFVRVLAYIEYSGIFLNKEKWLTKIEEDKINYKKSLDALNDWVTNNNYEKYIDSQLNLFNTIRQCNINWRSPKQVAPLFKDIGIDTSVIDAESGEEKDSVDFRVLNLQKEKHELVSLYLEYKRYDKVRSTYGESFLNLINPVTGRVHTDFTQILTTGRLSSGGRKAINLQNIPADERTRSCFTVQRDGYKLINIDYSGQEARILANFSKDEELIRFYNSGLGDMYVLVASKIFPELKDVPLNEIKSKYPEKRQFAKIATLAISYGANGETIARNLGIPLEEGNKFYESYWKEFQGVKKYMDYVKAEAFTKGYIQFNEVTKSKTFIYFFKEFKELEKKVNAPHFWQIYREEKDKDSNLYYDELKPIVKTYFKKRGEIERMASNYVIQGSGAEIMKVACIFLFKYLEINNLLFKVYLSNSIHDELLIELPAEYANDVAREAKSCMEKAADRFCKLIPIHAEPKITDWWGH